MKGKILFVAGLGLGYLFGTRAGREKYDQLKETALKFWNDPRLQKQVDAVEDFVKDKAPEVAEFVTDNAKTLTDNAKSLVNKVAAKVPTPKKKPARGSTGVSSTGAGGSTSARPSSSTSS